MKSPDSRFQIPDSTSLWTCSDFAKMTLSESPSYKTASPQSDPWRSMQVETGNWKLETVGHFMAEVTLPLFPEPRIRPNLSRPTHRVPKLRDVSAVFQFIHSRSFDASGQNPVSRIAGWGSQGAPSFRSGKIPDSKFQVP